MQALLKATPLSKTRQPNPPDQSQMATSVVSPIHRLISMYDVFSCFVLNECLELCKDQSSLYVMHSLCQWVHAWSFSSSFQLELIPPRGGVSQCIQFNSFNLAISIAPLQVLYYSEALPTTARILYRSFTPKRTGNCR